MVSTRGGSSAWLTPLWAATQLAFASITGCTGEIADPVRGWGNGVDAPGGSDSRTGSPASSATNGPSATPNTKPDTTPATDPLTAPSSECLGVDTVGRSPLRRLTRFEYNNTVRDLLGDTTSPAKAFPSEEIGNGFGNDADAQSVSGLLAEQYGTVAQAIAERATAAASIGKLDACATNLAADKEAACARTIVAKLAARAYRRPLVAGEVDELVALYTAARAKLPFATALATPIEALLQTPDFLYRVELGTADAAKPSRLRPSGPEMATRLAYLFWGTSPDTALDAAAASGGLSADAGIRAQAERLLADPKSHLIVRFFFDNLLPIASLSQLERDPMLYPAFTAAIGGYFREETQRFLEYAIFEGEGTWSGALTAPFTFVNGPLASYYGMPGVTGTDFSKVSLDTTQRLGLLTQGGVMAGSTPSNQTNPVLRGSFIAQKLMCRPLSLPTDPNILAKVKPPDPYSGKTARDRYGAHSKDPVCASCHQFMDPIGLSFENYDAVGAYRTQENGVTIDASGALPGTGEKAQNGIELARLIAASEDTQNCFALQWINYAYGRTLDDAEPADACLKESVAQTFRESGQNVQKLLVELTQTEAFLYLPSRAAVQP